MMLLLKILGVLALFVLAMLTVPFAQTFDIIDWQWWAFMSPAWAAVIAVFWWNRPQC